MNSCISLIFYITGALVCSLPVESLKIRGTPGVDYPTYPEIPKTSFRCSEQKYIPGFYADLETQCQVFHFCYESRQESFLCPTGTIFNQKILGCDSWYSFNCSLATMFYNVNAGPIIGEGFSGLLKMKDRSRDNTRASTSNVFQKISSLYEESTEQTASLDSNVENTATEGGSDKSAIAVDKQKSETIHEENAVDDKGSVNVSEVLENLIADLEKIKNGEKFEDEASYSDEPKNSDIDVEKPAELYSELANRGVMYDPETQQYYLRDYDTSEEDWEDGFESMNEEYRNYYDDGFEDILLHGENEPTNMLGNYVDEQVNVEGIQASDRTKKIPENFDLNEPSSLDFDEFSKRMLGTEQQFRRFRRKPVYVVLDDTDLNFSPEPEQSLNVLVEKPTESSYFAESISIDDLILESSTEVPLQQAKAEDIRVLDQLQRASNEEESIKDVKKQIPDLNASSDNSQTSEKFQVPSVSDLESGVLDFPQQGASEVETDDFLSFENERLTYPMEESVKEAIDEDFLGDDQSAYSESDVLQDEPETVISYEDSDDFRMLPDLSEQDIPSESLIDGTELDETLVYIPDSMDYEVSEDEESEDVEYNPMGYPQNEGWAYIYSNSPENPESDDSYESMQAGAQDFESEEAGSYDTYAEYMGQSYVPDSPESADSQYLASEYKFVETEDQFLPEDYRFIMDNRNIQPFELPGTSYHSEAITDPEYSQFDLPAAEHLDRNAYYPDDEAPLEEQSAGSYGYRYVQPNMQQIVSVNDYPYSQQYDYIYDSLNGIQYPYENDIEDQSGTVSFEDLAESVNVDEQLEESMNLKSSEQPEMNEYPSESEVEGKENFESLSLDAVDETSSDTGSDDLRVDYIKAEPIRQSDFDDIDGSEEIFYVYDFDEDSGTLEASDEPSYDSLNLDQGESLDLNYPEDDVLNEESNDFLGESKHDTLKSTPSERRATDSFEVSESGGNDISPSRTSFVTSEGTQESSLDSLATADDMSTNGDISQSKNGRHLTGSLSYHTLDNKGNEKPAILSTGQEHRLASFKPAKDQSLGRDFMVPSEMFMNNMEFPNSVGFGPYVYGNANIGQQFSMIDSTNTAAFSKKNGEIADHKENVDQTRLSKLSSLKDRVLAMTRGKFGMFKKSLKKLK